MRIMIVDDHEVVRLGLRALLASEADLEVVAEADSAAEAVQLANQHRPDLVLMDVRLPDASGIDACRDVRNRWPEIQVLILTSFADEELVEAAVRAGAAGYVLKQLETGELLRAVRAVADGDAVLDPKVTRAVLATLRRADAEAAAAAFPGLSSRELEVLAHLATGKTNAQIADAMFLSRKTVRNYVSAILAKLGLTNRVEAAAYAVRHDIEGRLGDRLGDS